MNDLFSDLNSEPKENLAHISQNNIDQSFAELLSSVSMDDECEEDSSFSESVPDEFIPYDSYDQGEVYHLAEDFLEGMNPEQKEAVLYDTGSLLVLAGAGSGKTRVITHRFAYLVNKYQLKISNILCVTFTNKAAAEMKTRIGDLLGVNTRTAWVRTFHSMCTMILRIHAACIGYSCDFTIYDATDTKNTIKKIMERLKIDPKNYSDKAIARMISSSKESLISVQEFEHSAKGEFGNICAEVYKEYQESLKQNQAMDFSDLISNTIVLLEQNPQIREQYQRQWHFVMADEFQDTNKPQYHLLTLLSRNCSNVCVVGDDDQSIYAWRGARVENIRQFQKEFQAHVIRLEQNYRSCGNILLGANAIVQSIKGRMPKTLRSNKPQGDKIVINCLGDDRLQASYVYEEMKKIMATCSKSYKDFAILYRINAQSRVVEEVMTRHQVPYQVYGGQRFFDRVEIKDILSYLRVIVNPRDTEAFDRIVNIPKRKIGDVGKQKIQNFLVEHQLTYPEVCIRASEIDGITKNASENLQHLGNILRELQESMASLLPTQMIKILIESIQYFEAYLVVEYGRNHAEDRLKNIEELVNAVKVFEDTNPGASIADFLREASLLSTLNDTESDDLVDSVSLMTIHSAKGLEFDVVFVIGVADGILPLARSRTQEELDEEKRLLYVAITRAKDRLYLTYEQQSLRYGELIYNEKSYFLDALPADIVQEINQKSTSDTFRNHSQSGPKEGYKKNTYHQMHKKSSRDSIEYKNIKTQKITSLLEIAIGQKVMHTVFGIGTVEYVSNAMVRILFDRFGTQVLMGNTVSNLTKII